MHPASTEFKRHYQPLSERETDDVIELVADLIVNFPKGETRPGAFTESWAGTRP